MASLPNPSFVLFPVCPSIFFMTTLPGSQVDRVRLVYCFSSCSLEERCYDRLSFLNDRQRS